MQVRLNAAMARPIETLAQRLKLARTARGLTQVALAKRAELNQSDVSKIERGDVQKTANMTRLARELGVDPWWLETGEGDPPEWLGEFQPYSAQKNEQEVLTADVSTLADAAMLDVDWHTLALQIAMGNENEKSRALLLDFLEMVSRERSRLMQAIADRAKQHTPKGAKG